MSTLSTSTSGKHLIYVPGYAWVKILLTFFGLCLSVYAFWYFSPKMVMAFSGKSVMAETVQVVVVDKAGTETVLNTDKDVQSKEDELKKSRDRSQVFWLEYRFTTEDGNKVLARSPIGQVMKPLHPLRDQDGLPFTIRLWYHPQKPQEVIIPFQFLPGSFAPFGLGTFFLPGVMLLLGLTAMGMGILMWYYANKPISMPNLAPSA